MTFSFPLTLVCHTRALTIFANRDRRVHPRVQRIYNKLMFGPHPCHLALPSPATSLLCLTLPSPGGSLIPNPCKSLPSPPHPVFPFLPRPFPPHHTPHRSSSLWTPPPPAALPTPHTPPASPSRHNAQNPCPARVTAGVKTNHPAYSSRRNPASVQPEYSARTLSSPIPRLDMTCQPLETPEPPPSDHSHFPFAATQGTLSPPPTPPFLSPPPLPS